MKDKILVFIIGLLVGAIITTSVFVIVEKANKKTDQMPNRGDMHMMEGSDEKMKQERPNELENDETRPEPPSKENQMKEVK